MEMLVRTIWKSLNSVFQGSSSGAELNFLLVFILLHILLAIATLGLGGKTVCEILRPLKRIFKPELPSLQEGIAEVTMAIPEALPASPPRRFFVKDGRIALASCASGMHSALHASR